MGTVNNTAKLYVYVWHWEIQQGKAKGHEGQDLNRRELMLQVIPVIHITQVFIANSGEDSFLTG